MNSKSFREFSHHVNYRILVSFVLKWPKKVTPLTGSKKVGGTDDSWETRGRKKGHIDREVGGRGGK